MSEPTRDLGRYPLFVACAPGVEPWLLAELAELGFEAQAVAGGAELETDRMGCYRVLLGCRLGLSLRLRLSRFRSTHFAQFEKQLLQQPWRSWLPAGAAVRAKAVARRSRLYHTGGICERLERAVATAMGRAAAQAPAPEQESLGTAAKARARHSSAPPPDLEPDQAPGSSTFLLHARMERDRCTLSLDLCGGALHRRAYRLQSGKAPLREDLAAALLRVAGYDGTQVLVDPLCGAGTLAIEGALIAAHRWPGARRAFPLYDLPFHAADGLAATLAGAPSVVAPAHAIVGSDRDAGAIAAATANAVRADVHAAVALHVAALSQCPVPALAAGERGLIVTNPPYGRRIGHRGELRNLYASLGALRQRAGDGYRLALVTSEPSLAHATGLSLEPVVLTDAGGIKVRFYLEP